MKILFLSEFLIDAAGKITGGDEARTFYTAKYLAKFGHEVTILTSLLPNTKRIENIDGVKIIRVGTVRHYIQSGDVINRLVVFPLSIVLQGFKVDFDVIDGNSVAAWPLARILGIIKRKKTVYWVPDVLGKNWQSVLGKTAGLIASLIESSCAFFPPDKIVALSQNTQGKLLKLGVLKNRITVIYPGIISVSTHKRRKDFTIISVNRLTKYKRNDQVIKALPDEVTYKIIGDGQERENLQKISHGKKVLFLGNLPHDQVLNELKKAEVFCLASEIEGFGIVTLEAMAAGIPFINSDIPVHREIAAKSQAGLLFQDDLKEKIELLIKDKNLYQKLSQNALAFARAHTWDKMTQKYEDLLSH